ncbi:MAG: SCO family protein [Bacteroidota bacterium]
MNINKSLFFICLILLAIAGCAQVKTADGPLPIIGNRYFEAGDTVYHQIPDFEFINQDSQLVTNEAFEGKMYVADFFFISCPTICPIVKKQMLRIYERFESEDRVALFSHSIDTKYDTIPRLKNYSVNLGVSAPKWNFVTGDEEEIYDIADDYFSIAIKDPSAPGGFDHSGRLILVDDKRHVRAFCDGTDEEDVDQFMKDIQKLVEEYDQR